MQVRQECSPPGGSWASCLSQSGSWAHCGDLAAQHPDKGSVCGAAHAGQLLLAQAELQGCSMQLQAHARGLQATGTCKATPQSIPLLKNMVAWGQPMCTSSDLRRLVQLPARMPAAHASLQHVLHWAPVLTIEAEPQAARDREEQRRLRAVAGRGGPLLLWRPWLLLWLQHSWAWPLVRLSLHGSCLMHACGLVSRATGACSAWLLCVTTRLGFSSCCLRAGFTGNLGVWLGGQLCRRSWCCHRWLAGRTRPGHLKAVRVHVLVQVGILQAPRCGRWYEASGSARNTSSAAHLVWRLQVGAARSLRRLHLAHAQLKAEALRALLASSLVSR